MTSAGGSESCREGRQDNLRQIVGLEVVRSKIKRDLANTAMREEGLRRLTQEPFGRGRALHEAAAAAAKICPRYPPQQKKHIDAF